MNRNETIWDNLMQYFGMLNSAIYLDSEYQGNECTGMWIVKWNIVSHSCWNRNINSTKYSGWFNLSRWYSTVGRHPLDSCLRWFSCKGRAGRPAVPGGALMRSTVLKVFPPESQGCFRRGHQNAMLWIVKQLQHTNRIYINTVRITIMIRCGHHLVGSTGLSPQENG